MNTIISGQFQDNPYGEGQLFDDYYPYFPIDPASEDSENSGWNSIPLYGRAIIITLIVCLVAAGAVILYTKLHGDKVAKDADGGLYLTSNAA